MFRRLPLLSSREAVAILREAIRAEKVRRPFQIDAMVILPYHIHAIWTLPPYDADYSIRWRNIKPTSTQKIEPVYAPLGLEAANAKASKRYGNADFGNIVSVPNLILAIT